MKKINLKNLRIIKYFKQKIYNFKYDWSYLGVLNSPFVGLRLKWYFGKIQHGTPYFLPRKWVKVTKEDYRKSLIKELENGWKYPSETKWEDYKGRKKAVPIKYFGFNSCSLGWKTKWDEYRFEWAPCYSIVIFGKQLFVCVLPKMDKNEEDSSIRQDCYWEAWLNYRNTDKTKSVEERLEELKSTYSCTWGNSEKGYTDYYPMILKKKYIKEKNENKLI